MSRQASSPTGPPDFSGPLPVANRPVTIIAVCTTLAALCWFTTLSRLWMRIKITKSPGWDDIFVTITMLVFTLLCTCVGLAPRFGFGKHIQELSPAQISKIILSQYMFGASYGMSTATIKLSLLFQFLRVFPKHSLSYRFTQIVLILVAGWGFSMSFICWFPCFPAPSAWWNGTARGCYGIASPNLHIAVNLILGHAATNVFWDTLVFGLAFRLQFLHTGQASSKGVRAVFLIGLCSWAFAIWRMVDIVQSKSAGIALDPSFDEPQTYLLSVAEVYLASLYATIPFFWPFIDSFTKIFVTYGFEISTESRFPDEDIEMERGTAYRGNSDSTIDKNGVGVSESRDGLILTQDAKQSKTAHYGDTHIQNQGHFTKVP